MALNDNSIGHFMVAVGAIILDSTSGKILLLKRNDQFHFGEWEVPYGRLAQHEEILTGLAREIQEETGITQFQVQRVLRLWHVYRGEKTADKEIFGTTFLISVSSPTITLSDEHTEYRWVKPTEALNLIKVKGIHADVAHYVTSVKNNSNSIMIADSTESVAAVIGDLTTT